MLRRQSLAPAVAILLGAALCALPATNTRAGNVTQQPSASGPAWTWTWPDTAGTNGYVLTTDGTGVTSWAPPGGLGITLPLSSLLPATTTNSIDSGSWAQTWKWNGITVNNALSITSSTITSGSLLALQATTTGPAATGGVLYVQKLGGAGSAITAISDSTGMIANYIGAGVGFGISAQAVMSNNTGYAGYFTNASAGTSYGVYSSITGAGNTGYAGYFANASGSGYGIYALGTTSTGAVLGGGFGHGAAILANQSNASNTAAAVYAINPSANGYAVFGYNTSGGGGVGIEGAGTTGVYGISTSATAGATAVYAFQNSVSGQTFGVQSSDFSPSGYAVYGLNFATTGNARGVYGETNSTTSGRAVEGKQSGAGNTGYAGYFANTATTGVNFGVYGTVASINGNAAAGYFSNTAVNGTGNGVTGISASTGVGAAAVAGYMNAAGNTGFAGYFVNNSASGGTTGIYASVNSPSNGATALYASNGGGSGSGYSGYFTINTAGAGYGVYGTITGAANTGYAGYFSNTSTTGYALYVNGMLGAAGVSGAAAPTSTTVNYSEMTGNSNGATVAAASTVYGPANGAFTMSATVPGAIANNEISMVSRAATVQNLYYLASAANGSGKTNTITVYKNGGATALTCSVTNTTICSDTSDSFTVAAGDWLSVQVVTASASTAVRHTWSIELSY